MLSQTDIKSLLPEYLNDQTPGCAVAILADGQLTTYVQGLASVEHKVAIHPDTAFRIASVTKHFLAIVALAEQDAGRVDLDIPMGSYLKQLSGGPATATMRQALQNCSDIRDHLELEVLLGGSVASPIRRSQSLDIIGRCQETNFEPGTSFLYSNANFLLVTEILERQAGQSLGDLMQHHIFDPAGLAATRYEPLHSDIIPHRATGYLKRSEGYQLAALQTELTGDGALISTLSDMIRWADYCDTDPDGWISRISERCIFANGHHSDYELGYYIRDYNGLRTLGHNGTWPGFRSEILRVPERNLSVIGLANVNMIDLSSLTRDIVDLMTGRPEDALASARKPAKTCASITKGAYLNSETGDFFHLEDSDGTLVFGLYGGELELVTDTPSTAQFRYSHEYRSVDWSQAERGLITLTKMNGETVTAQSAGSLEPARDLADYNGVFCNEELGIEIRLTFETNDLGVEFHGAFAPHLTWRARPICGDAVLVYSDDGDWRCQLVLVYPKTGQTKAKLHGPRVRGLELTYSA